MVDVSDQVVVAVLTRAPSSGGKTRLFEALQRSSDETLLQALLLDTLDAVHSPGTTRVVCYAPADAGQEMRPLVSPGVGLLAQREGDLGERMKGVFEDLLQQGARAVILLGSDLPLLPGRVMETARQQLASDPQAIVIGPAVDGGYYLIGAARIPPVFEGIAWSQPDVLAQTLTCARTHGARVVLLDAASDVDTLDDLRDAARGGARRTGEWVGRNL